MDDELKAQLTSSWDLGAADYDRAPRHGVLHDDEWTAWRRLVAAILGDPSHSAVHPLRVLDVGTGTGLLALLAAELGHDVTALDLSEGMLAQAHRKAASMGLHVAWRLADAESLEADLAGFDAVVSRHVLWTLPHPDRAVAAWRDAARPGGLIAIIDGWHARRPWSIELAARAARRYVDWRLRRAGHGDHDYTPGTYARLPLARLRDTRAVARLLEAAGLERVTLRPLSEVDRIERSHLGPVERLADPWRRYLATGRTPILVSGR